LVWPAYGDDAATPDDLLSGVDAYIFCDSGRVEVASCGRLQKVYSLLSRFGINSDDHNPDSKTISANFAIEETEGPDTNRRRFGRSASNFDAGLMKSMLEGKLLGMRFRHYLAPYLRMSGQAGLGFTGGSPDTILSFEIRFAF
jgi:hypothetical protein